MSKSTSISSDFDLDSALNLEAACLKEGEALGLQRAASIAQADATHLGRVHGKELGAELGSYAGFLCGVESMLAHLPQPHPATQRVRRLASSVNEFPLDQPLDAAGQDKLDRIRSSFKVLASNLNCSGNLLFEPSADSIKGNAELF